MDQETRDFIAKMNQSGKFKPSKRKKVEYGFDALFKDN